MSDDIKIMPASAEAMNKKHGRKMKYPWYSLEIGQAFGVNPADMTFKSLTNYAYRMGKKSGRVFSCINHGHVYEVACVEMNAVAKKQQNEVNVPNKVSFNFNNDPVDK